MDCLNCGAPLHKNDIFCLNCETPVLTDDDLELLANVDFSTSGEKTQDTLTVSSSDGFFDDLTFDEDDASGEPLKEIDLQSDYVQKENSKRKAIIIAASIICAVIIGFGVFLLFRSPSAPQGDGNPIPPLVEDNRPAQTPDPDEDDDIIVNPTPDVIYGVTGIEVLRGGRVQDEFHVSIGETVLLTSRLIPEGAIADVTWSSSDTEVIEVYQADSSGYEATVIGVGAGVADIIVTIGSMEERYIIFVDNMSITTQLENALNDSSTAIWLTISWLDDERFGQEVVFERDLDTQSWILESAAERGEVVPIFTIEHTVIQMSFDDSDNTYFLFDDATGFYGLPDSTENDDFMWWFKTTLIEPEG